MGSNPGATGEGRSLRDRIAAIQGMRPAAPPPLPVVQPPAAPVTLPDGREEETPFGTCYVVERTYPLDHQHGPHPLAALSGIERALLADLGGDRRLRDLPLERLVFLDTETTGLAGGTGTHVFLIGLGFFATDPFGDQCFVVRQYFLRQLREERALLHGLGTALADSGALVTFNGKSFDWPLLATRFTLHRHPLASHTWPHLDLLHPARRIWKHRLPSCALGNLEREVLGIHRVGDIPGALIPDLYFRYLRDGDARPLLPVLAHNQSDIVSLLGLLIHLGVVLAATGTVTLPGADHFGLAALHAAHGRQEASIAAYRVALADPSLSPALRRAAKVALVGTLKRARRWDEASVLWRDLMRAEARRKAPDPWAYVELAKYQEHLARDYPAAITTVEAALALLELRGVRTERDALHHRLARLRRKATGRPGIASAEESEGVAEFLA
jgi:uncharacterized protein YprB with RNaseH-like and TPR domain